MKSLPDLMFGPMYHSYVQESQFETNVQFSDMPADKRVVLFTLKSIWKARLRGPKWARKRQYVGHVVHWYANMAIPIGNTKDGYKTVKAADFEVVGDYAAWGIWTQHAPGLLQGLVTKIRERNGFYWEGMKLRANNTVN